MAPSARGLPSDRPPGRTGRLGTFPEPSEACSRIRSQRSPAQIGRSSRAALELCFGARAVDQLQPRSPLDAAHAARARRASHGLA
jgi:hypothetical protein